jgi:hypothetical protein
VAGVERSRLGHEVVGATGLHVADVPDGLPRGRHHARVHAISGGLGALQH